MTSILKKRVIRITLITFGIGALGIAILFAILSSQQERIVNLAIGELNKQSQGELTIEKSSISLFKNFPYVSVALRGGRFFEDKTKRGEPIYEFDDLYIGFNLSDLLHENYNIKMAFMDGGRLRMVQEPDGRINLVEAETRKDDASVPKPSDDQSKAFALDLQKIILKNVDVFFHDKANGMKYATRVGRLESAVKMDSARLAIALKSEMKLDITGENDTTIFRDKAFYIDIAADYELGPQIFKISTCYFKLEEAGFNVTGQAGFADTTEVNFRVKGNKQDFNLFTAFLPAHVKANLKPFEYDGRLHFDGVVSGKVGDGQYPLIAVTFGCEDAWFLNTDAKKKVDQLGFKGYYTNGSDRSLATSEVHIINVSARPEKGIFKGHFVVRDFTKPKAIIKINSELELKFLGEFLGIPDLKQITGKIKLDMNFRELQDITLPEESLSRLKEGIQSRLSVENLSFRIPGYPHEVKDMNILAEMKDGRVTIDTANLRIGESDIEFKGSISDVRGFLRDRHKAIKLAMNVRSDQVMLANLLSYDTALAHRWNEEIHGFNIDLSLETTASELLNPSPLPRGTFEMRNLRGKMKNYAHTLKNLTATVMINDTLLRLRDFTGMIDSSDFNFKGRIINYHLWFDEIKKGRTQIAFDFKSNHFALRDVFGREVRKNLPRGYRREVLNKVWLRSKIDLKYDTIFRFAKGKITNISAELKQHKLELTEISGGFKYGSKILAFDTLRGKVGNSDFDVSLKYYFKGIDRNNNKVANTLKFNSRFLDADQLSRYDLAPKTGRSRRDTTKIVAVAHADSSGHAHAFNVFMIPFSDFNAEISIAKVKYTDLMLEDISARISMREDQTISLDTLTFRIADGAIRMRGKFNGKDHQKIYFRSRINFDNVDIEKMLVKLDAFGQDVVINKNLKGRLTGSIRSQVLVHPDLVPIVDNSKAQMQLKISNGSLVDFAPMQAMAGYFKDKNLRLIRFDTLENKLTFNNGVLEIPTMEINSSIGYIQVSGKQSIDMNMEYYLRVPMKMVTKAGLASLLNGKPEEVDMNQIDEIEVIDKEKKIAFMNIKVTGTPDNFKVGLGKEKGKKAAL
jgi:hypothetical protein